MSKPNRVRPGCRGGALARLASLLLVAFAAGGCSDADPGTPAHPILFGPEANNLNAYDTDAGFAKQTVIRSHAEDPVAGLDINGEVCFQPGGSRLFIAGEDTGQPAVPPAWGVFLLEGSRVGELAARRVNRLVATFQSSRPSGDPYGCGFLSDGRLATTDIGPEATGPAGGQLILWFPPLDAGTASYCKLDVEIGTAGAIWVDDENRIYVASSRVDPGVYRYSPPYPTANDAAGGCGRTDATGAPLADRVQREKFISIGGKVLTPSALVGSGHGTYYVASVATAVIGEYDAAGSLLGYVLEPPDGERLGPQPISTGTPFGLAIDGDGILYYADLGLVIRDGGIGPGPRTGTERRIRFAEPREGGAPEPLPPETMDAGLSFPDGLGLFPR